MRTATKIGDWCVRIVTGVLVIALLAYGGLMLRDMIMTEIRAFASYDLMKYRPNIEEDEPPYLDELLAINADTAGWLTIYNTNIDYPVMQGEDDMEYINKDVYGEYTVSGSIFMSSENAKDFSDPYTLVYGHHMTNGSMFGDLPKFKDETFFAENETGIVIMEEKAYDLTVMALLETDAYDDAIYQVKKRDLRPFIKDLEQRATFFRPVEYEQLLALSTSNDANTSGRTVLVCAMNTRTAPLPDREYGRPAPRRKAMGHPLAGAHWALLNLIALAAIAFFSVRMIWLTRRQRRWRRAILVIAICTCSLVLFLFSEDIRRPMQMVDRWTPVMLILMLLLYLSMVKRDKD